MTKIVINAKHGGFSLSKEGCQRYWDIKGKQVWIEDDKQFKSLGLFTVWLVPPEERVQILEGKNFYEAPMEERRAFNEAYSAQTWYDRDVARDDPVLVQVVDEMGAFADGAHASLKIVEIPDDVNWVIEEYDGSEWVAEMHRTWS